MVGIPPVKFTLSETNSQSTRKWMGLEDDRFLLGELHGRCDLLVSGSITARYPNLMPYFEA